MPGECFDALGRLERYRASTRSRRPLITSLVKMGSASWGSRPYTLSSSRAASRSNIASQLQLQVGVVAATDGGAAG